ncbi:MAG: sigma-70 family RNA polymerase sigma factor [Deltaproteobacteria bacterium]|nr:MAG: sigma-70 family RNA polymerase sigma factor [Deltaproteobacteria bacterium]
MLEEQDELVVRLRSGDRHAFRQLVDALHPRLLRFVNRLCPPPSVAEEVVQDTWHVVIDRLHTFRGDSRLSTWIFQIATHRARTRAVREGRYAATLLESWDHADPGGDGGLSRFDSRGRWVAPPAGWPPDDPEASAMHQQALARISEVIDQLPEAQRAVVLLRDVEGLDTREVSTILGLSPANVRVLLHRGRHRVRSELEAVWTGRESC